MYNAQNGQTNVRVPQLHRLVFSGLYELGLLLEITVVVLFVIYIVLNCYLNLLGVYKQSVAMYKAVLLVIDPS